MKKIAIIGCGVSGLYFANLLSDRKLYDYTIFEKKSEIDLNDGYGIQLSVNSIKLLNHVGFGNMSINEISFPRKVNFFDAKTTQKICDIDISRFNREDCRYTLLKRSSLIKFLLKNIPSEKIKNNLELKKITCKEKIKLILSDNSSKEFDYLIVSDGAYSKTKSTILTNDTSPKFFNSVALRANIKNFDNTDISIYMGPNFHFVIYPVNQNDEFNFVSIIKKKLNKEHLSNHNLFQSNEFLKSLTDEIYEKSSLKLRGRLENIKSFPIYVSKKFDTFKHKNIFFVGDSLFSFSPSFAQGASQSIESSKEAFDAINNEVSNYYEKRIKKIKEVNLRSNLNYFAFHLSNPIAIFFRNIILKLLVKNKNFLENYLGRIYKD